MKTTRDVIVVGGGHNGLVAAAYLARAGRSVLVLEQRPIVGGLATTDEFAPGFRCSPCFTSAELFHASVAEQLQLRRYGFEPLPLNGGVLLPLADEGCFWVAPPARAANKKGSGKTQTQLAEEIRRFSAADVASFAAFEEFLERLVGVLDGLFAKPLPDLERLGAVDKLDMLRIGWQLRRLGRQQMREAMRLLPMPVANVLDERFEAEPLKAALAACGLRAAAVGPLSPGSAFGLLYHRRPGGGPFATPRFVRGGLGGLSEALAVAVEAAGGELQTDTRVARILATEERVHGVLLADGTEIAARVVVSNLDPRQTLLGLLDPQLLAPDVVAGAAALRARGAVAVVRFALDALPEFAAATGGKHQLAGRIQIGPEVCYLEKAFDDAKYGRLPRRPYLEITVPSIADPSLAPSDHHVMQALMHYAPNRLQESTWGEQRAALEKLIIDTVAAYAPNFATRIVATDVLTPADFEERYGLSDGCVVHADLLLDQALYLRPLPGWAQYRMPIGNLYLCGSGTHPGGGITGLPGRNAARQLLIDWQRGEIL